MINAGVEILGFDGGQSFNATSSLWEGIKVKVNYPEEQTLADNPIGVGDFLIEPTGVLWVVEGITAVPTNDTVFTVNIKRQFGETTADNGPALGQVSRGAITTPDKGFVTPHWSSTLVSLDVTRYASTISTQLNNRENTADRDKPISLDTELSLNQKLDEEVANTTFARSDALGNAAGRDITVSMGDPTGGKHGDLWLKIV